ncbi:MAG: ABC transporter substrate-binding protein [Sulfolobales archaeon]|nr:ABC transporter substrate-binding protein [Sulfolobales archaeon]
MRFGRRLLIVTGLVVFLVVSISVFSSLTYFIGPQIRVVVYAYRDAITGIDPSVEFDTGLVVLGSVYEPLFYYNPLTNQFTPALAVSWTKINETFWVFKLRDDVVFHDGTPLTVEAVRFSILRTKVIYDETGLGSGYIWSSVEDIVAINKTAVGFKLKYPAPIDLIASSSYGAYIYSPRVLEYSGAKDLTDKSIRSWFESGRSLGSGPYYIEYYNPVSEIRLRKFEKWWGWAKVGNLRAPDLVVIRIVGDPVTQVVGLRGGSIHIAMAIPKAEIRSLVSEGFKLIRQYTYYSYILMFNTRRWPTSATEFRLAILHSIPWDELIDRALYGYGISGSGIIPYRYPGYIDGLRFKYDLDLAREYLRKAGLEGREVEIEIVITTGYEEEEIFAMLLKSELLKLGIKLTIRSYPWEVVKEYGAAVWRNPEEAPHLIINDWWPTYSTPYDYLYLVRCDSVEWNWSGYCSEELDTLLDTAYELEGVDYEEALRLYEKAQYMIFQEAFAISLWTVIQTYVTRPNIIVRDEAFNPLYMYAILFQYVEVL